MSKSYDEMVAELKAEWGPEVRAFEAAAREYFETVHAQTFLVGKQLAERRAELRWSQRQLAAEADVPQADVSRIENGKLNPTLETLSKIASALGLDIRLVPRT